LDKPINLYTFRQKFGIVSKVIRYSRTIPSCYTDNNRDFIDYLGLSYIYSVNDQDDQYYTPIDKNINGPVEIEWETLNRWCITFGVSITDLNYAIFY
jgi:hypothetical protein